MLLLFAAGACGAEPLSVDEFEASYGTPAPLQPDAPVWADREPERLPERLPEGGAGTPASTTPAHTIGFGDGATVVSEALGAIADGVLTEVVLYDGYGIVSALDRVSGHLQRVVVRPTGVQPPERLPISSRDDPNAIAFEPTAVDWSIVPGLVAKTPVDLGIADGKVSHVIVEHNVPFSPDLVIRVYVTAPGGGGRIDYDANGRPKRSFRD